MKLIALTQGRLAKVDDDQYALLSRYKWCAMRRYPTWYAIRTLKNSKGKRVAILMHNVVMPNAPLGMEVDHINSDGLDNRKENLRYATHQQNVWNSTIRSDNTTGFIGVRKRYRKTLTGVNKYWVAEIRINGIQKHVGCFWSPEEAAMAYDKLAKELRGQFAKTNFPSL